MSPRPRGRPRRNFKCTRNRETRSLATRSCRRARRGQGPHHVHRLSARPRLPSTVRQSPKPCSVWLQRHLGVLGLRQAALDLPWRQHPAITRSSNVATATASRHKATFIRPAVAQAVVARRMTPPWAYMGAQAGNRLRVIIRLLDAETMLKFGEILTTEKSRICLGLRSRH